MSDWRPTLQQVLWAARIAFFLGLLVAIGYYYGITLWDWLKLLVVPAAIAAGGLWFNRQQQERQREDNRQQQERGLEIENERAQDQALQAYLDQMGQLLLDKDNPLRQSNYDDEVRTLARALTLAVLRELQGDRPASLLGFLYEAELLGRSHEGDVDHFEWGAAIISLRGADLKGADMRSVDLSGADLGGVNLSGANLSNSMFWRSSLSKAVANNAILRGARLYDTDLSKSTLVNSDLRDADLQQADLSDAYLRGADLSNANLLYANLKRARMRGVKLIGVDLSGADLKGADLTNADLTDAVGITEFGLHLLREKVKSLEGAIMPKGQKYEDWLKEKASGGSA